MYSRLSANITTAMILVILLCGKRTPQPIDGARPDGGIQYIGERGSCGSGLASAGAR